MCELVKEHALFGGDIQRFVTIAKQFGYDTKMPVTHRFDLGDRCDKMPGCGLFGRGNQRISCTGKCRHNHNRLTVHTTANDVYCARDRSGVGDRRAAELGDDHGRAARAITPAFTNSSAFNTDPPAAPRMVLCPIATSRR